ncbi:AraC family transcriptional regulator [Gryllotalpicola protaetiae]|uniref:AraC family transcriptional regulator n=2 Tax=Gryllotalpicola protaetiae TaxID=2419771 RepID=A0A387BR95_9MICO|nr:AraC family transcriptional regulator [Gryllotalpicola protaetiae]
MSLFRTTTPTQPLGGIARANLALVLRGAKRSSLGEQVYDYRAGQFLIVTVDLPLTSQITEASPRHPFVALGMPLQPEIVSALMLESDGTARRIASEREQPGLAVSDADDDLLGAIERLLRLADRPLDYRLLAPGVKREIHWRLLSGPQGGLVRQFGLPDSRLSLVGKAVGWLRANLDAPLRADDLAARLGLSVSSLNRYFRAITGMSPLQYQKALRLQQARLELLAAPGDIARVGHAVGYQSLSQFSREYRRMFGAPPSEDAARLQTAELGAE